MLDIQSKHLHGVHSHDNLKLASSHTIALRHRISIPLISGIPAIPFVNSNTADDPSQT
jgi:hypothetical protein